MTTEVRRLEVADLDVADAIATAAFHAPSSRREELAFYLSMQPDGWWLAEHDGQPAGIVGAVSYGSFASVGMMAVSPPLQRRGIGRALMDRVVAWLDARGPLPAVLEASESGAPLYPLFGFVDCGHSARYSAHLPGQPAIAGGPPSQLMVKSDLPDVLALDSAVYGADRARVLRAFSDITDVQGLVVRDAQARLNGFAFVRRGHVGPILAETESVARALLAGALSYADAVDWMALPPEDNARAIRLLESLGFVRERLLRHMRRGRLPHPIRRSDWLYGLASFALA